MIKKVLAAALCLSMVFAFASCGSSDDSSETSKAATTTAADEADAEDADAEGEGDATEEDTTEGDATEDTTEGDAAGADATAFVGTTWNATVIMDADQNSSTIADYCASTGNDESAFAMAISFTDETNCTLATSASEDAATWEFDGTNFTITDSTGEAKQLAYDADQSFISMAISDTLYLVLTQTA